MVQACRQRGLDAIAITDHHDFELVPYVREAAERELGDDGEAIPQDDRLIVFPGLELTLGVPCQALLLLSADFPSDRLGVVLEALAIEPVPSDQAHTGSVTRLERIASLSELHEELDAREWLKGNYVVLPNVTDGGHGTLMRTGMQGKYKEMPCTGGYLDGLVSNKVGEGNRRIFDGRDQAWGNKRLALFQTSDSRRADFDDLGVHTTWVKWAKPTAEAIRQACLAEESRISHERPALPSTHISRLSVSNSDFMGPIELELNPQYNAIIGGRGTGKSTCLEYLRWALCDQAVSSTKEDEIPDHASRRGRLIEDTLAPYDSHVDVHFSVNALPHVVRRFANSGEVQIKIGDGEFESALASDVRALLPVVAYSQKQLSSVAVRLDEMARFVTSPIRRQLDDVDVEIVNQAGLIRENYAALQRHRTLSAGIARDDMNVASLIDQANNLRSSIDAVSEEDRQTISSKPDYDRAMNRFNALNGRVGEAVEIVDAFTGSIGELLETLEESEDQDLVLTDELAVMEDELRSLLQSLLDTAAEATRQVGELRAQESTYAQTAEAVSNQLASFELKYEGAKERSNAHEIQLTELQQVEERQRATEASAVSQRNELRQLGEPVTRHHELRAKWRELLVQHSEAIQQQCGKLSDLSDGLIRASVRRGSGLRSLDGRLRGAVQGSGVRSAKIEQFFADLDQTDDPVQAWEECLDELEIAMRSVEDPDPPSNPRLCEYGFSESDVAKMASQLNPESWLDLALTKIEDQPYFEYRSKDGEYFDFTVASAGQQATALLRVLLAQGGPPLIIDQPEDDLDSQVIVDVVERVWNAKKTRQLLFTSHNANLVVNGDAELVVSCDYRAAGDHSGGRLKLEGAIDLEEIRKEITTVMEGGERAFRLRKEKYGF